MTTSAARSLAPAMAWPGLGVQGADGAHGVHAASDARGAEPRHARLVWTAAVAAAACAPHVASIPLWIDAFLAACLAWRLAVAFLSWPAVPPSVCRLLAVAGLLGVLAEFRTINGIEAGSALLVVMVAFKMLEARGPRDYVVLLIVAYFLLFTTLLSATSIGTAAYVFGVVWLATVALLKIGRAGSTLSSAVSLKLATRMLLQAVPFAAAMFVLFPRLSQPLWGLPASASSGVTGLSDSMSPGDITNLGLSDEVAFRVDFAGPAPPPHELYWRGPVLIDFDGRTWTRRQGPSLNRRSIEPLGAPTTYRVTLDASTRGRVFALDMPTRWDEQLFRVNGDFQLELLRFGTRSSSAARSYEVTSHTSYRATEPLAPEEIADYLKLPPESSPRTRALVAEWLADNPTHEQIVERAFAWIASRVFYYTLTPPPLGDEPVDEFLFETREGFCEHYASAFAVMLRAAGVPTRVVLGYQGGELNGFTGLHVVRQANAHAWTEVWLEERGWVRVDPVTAVLPERVSFGSLSAATDRAARFAVSGWMRDAALLWDAAKTYWSQAIVGYNAESQRSLLDGLGLRGLRLDERLVVLGALVLSAVLVLAVALSVYLQWRARLQRGADAAARIFAAFARRLARLRVAPPAPNEDPAAFALRAAAALPHAGNDIASITRAYLAARYEDDRDGRALAELKRRVSAFAPRVPRAPRAPKTPRTSRTP